MKKIKAIETRYKGYRFRSRLEARWAVFFDELGISYKYEEFGFEKTLGEEFGTVRWLPDFYLPDMGMWAEVKGGRPSDRDVHKMGALLDYDSPLPFIQDSKNSSSGFGSAPVLYQELGGDPKKYYRFFCPGVLLLGEVPYVEHGITLHPLVTHRKGLGRCYGQFMPAGLFTRVSDSALSMFNAFYPGPLVPDPTDYHLDGMCVSPEGNGESDIDFFTPHVYSVEAQRAHSKVCAAYRTARAARFEHGEQG